MVPSFDIVSLNDFRPATVWCQKCYGLVRQTDINAKWKSAKEVTLRCHICNFMYIPTEDFDQFRMAQFLKAHFSQPLQDVNNKISHAIDLAGIASAFRRKSPFSPPFRLLLEALKCAKSFVHFTSFGISLMMIGVLKVIAQDVQVRGIVSGNIGENVICEFTDYWLESQSMDIKFLRTNGYRTSDIPHHKLIVIDGLIAFKGSANLTERAWRSAADDNEIIEVVTDIEEVIELHNRYFSPIWAKENSRFKDRIQIQMRKLSVGELMGTSPST